MNEYVLIICFGIGVVAGLRCMTAPAVVSWAAYLGLLNLSSTPFYFFGLLPAVIFLTVSAILEIIFDKTPNIGNRTGLIGLSGRILTSSLCGAAIYSPTGSPITGALVALAGGMAGAFGGFYARKAIVRNTSLPDFAVALIEDALAITLGVACVYAASR